MLNIYKTNKIEIITEVLSKELLINPPYITEKLNISIQNYFLSKWMRDQITLKNEISALYEFQTLSKHTEELIRIFEHDKKIKSWNYESIKWSIVESLEELGEFKESWPLINWIKKFINNKGVLNNEIYSLCEKIAEAFSEYILYRPETLEKWYKTDYQSSKLFSGLNEDQYWQPILFKLIVKNKLHKPICIYMQEIIKNIGQYKNNLKISIPKNIYLVITNSLSKLQISFYSNLAEITNINIYLLSPGYELWNRVSIEEGEIFTNRSYNFENIETKFCKFIANFEKLIEEVTLSEELKVNSHTPFIDPTINVKQNYKSNLLHQIQKKIVTGYNYKFKIHEEDKSFIFRGCKNLLKELEYIKEKIIEICSHNKGVSFSDILIASNQINILKPYLKYIFNSNIKIPYFLSKENYKDISPVYNFLHLILEISNKKLGIVEIEYLLSDPIFQRINNFNNSEKEEILILLKDSGFHWGINSKERLGENKNNLEWCIKRFILGLIYGEDFYIEKYELIPFNPSNTSIDINKWIVILNQIKSIIESLRSSNSFNNWIIKFKEIFSKLEVKDDNLNEDINNLNNILYDFSKNIDSDVIIDLSVLINIFNNHFNNQKSNLDRRKNEVLISNLEDSRHIPHKITFLMGMNQIVYPRNINRENFNLINNQFRFGDPSLIDKEKYLFLELLISCREQFIVSWSNYDMENNLLEISSPIRQLINLLKNEVDIAYQNTLVKDLNINESNEIISPTNNYKEGLVSTLEFEDKRFKDNKLKLPELINWFKSPQLYWLKQKNIFPKKKFIYNPSDEGINNFQKYKLFNNLLVDLKIDDKNFKEKLNKLEIKRELISNGIISPQNRIYINQLEVHNLIQSMIKNFIYLNNIKRKYLKVNSNKIEFYKCNNQMIELIHTNINFVKKSEIWIKLLFIASFEKDIDKALIIYRKNNLYCTETLLAPTPLKASQLMEEYFTIYKNSIKNCLPLPPESSFKYISASIRNKDSIKAFIDEWVGNKNFTLGERDKPEMQICYGYEKDPYFFLNNKNFRELSLKLYKPLIESSFK